MKQLRPYQHQGAYAAQKALETVNRTVIVNPTGSGKTVLIAHFAKEFQHFKVLIITTRDRILSQFRQELDENSISYEIEKAQSKPSPDSKFVLASVMSMKGKRLQRWATDHFDYILADECHHASSEVYMNICNHFSKAKIIGFTATPNEPELCPIFKHVAYDYPIAQAIKDKWLATPVFHQAKMTIPLKNVRITAGELNEKDLSEVLEERIVPFAEAVSEKIMGKTLVFVPTIAVAELLKEALQKLGHKAEAFHSALPEEDASLIMKAMESDGVDVLINPASLVEGWNLPNLQTVIIGRPTTRLRFLIQMIGRVLRPKPDGSVANIVEFETEGRLQKVVNSKTMFFDPALQCTYDEALAQYYREKYGYINMYKLINAYREAIQQGLSKYLNLVKINAKPVFPKLKRVMKPYSVEKLYREWIQENDPKQWGVLAKLVIGRNGLVSTRTWADSSINAEPTPNQLRLLHSFGLGNRIGGTRGMASELIDYIKSNRKDVQRWTENLRKTEKVALKQGVNSAKLLRDYDANLIREYREHLRKYQQAEKIMLNASETPT